MKAMTSSAAIRTREDEATGTEPRTTRRRTVPPSHPVRLTTTPTGTARKRAAGTGTAVTRRAPARTVQAPARRPAPTAGRHAPTAGRHAPTAPRAPFALLVVGLLGGALVSLLLLNTVLAQQSFTRSELQQENQRLVERKQALQEDIARENSPEVLHAKARRLGMRDSGDRVVTDPRTGR
ncbi:FtsB family cell division protein [Actinoallomurus sp. CA-142502]|uniref:FtsB family cell division protein n=1 Tax=Actinoallomurus sp. CA-142502 TaxID=3239885 RepID=UPI003D91566E